MATSNVIQQLNWKTSPDIISRDKYLHAGPHRALHYSTETFGSPRLALGTWGNPPWHSRLQLGMHYSPYQLLCVLAFCLAKVSRGDLLIPALPEVDVLMDTANT